jgi:hypothetical protein
MGLNHRRRVTRDPVRGHLDVVGLIRGWLSLEGPNTGHGARDDTTSKLCLDGDHGRVILPHLLRGSIGRWLGSKLYLLRFLLLNGHGLTEGRLLVLHKRSSSVLWHLRSCRGLLMPTSPVIVVIVVVIVVIVVVVLRSSGIDSRVSLPGFYRLINRHPLPIALLHIGARLLRDDPLLVLPHIRASSLRIKRRAFSRADFPLALLCVVPDILNLTWVHYSVTHRPTLRSTASRAGGETKQSTGNPSLPLATSFFGGTDITIMQFIAFQRCHPQFGLNIG